MINNHMYRMYIALSLNDVLYFVQTRPKWLFRLLVINLENVEGIQSITLHFS